jgi:hypothetical protein
MHTLEFPHLISYDPGQEGITLPIHLHLDGKVAALAAKVDTGASYSIFQRQHGEVLGIDIETGLPLNLRTVTGSFIAYGHTLTLQVLDYHFDTMVYFARDEAFPRNVLGRHGWLDRVKLAIIDYEGKLFLSPYDLP